jgi:O-acetyl-ADP-ribose deacetylase (regulator of RNase III)
MRISVLQGDITQRRVDAVVNAANSSLLGGGGVDGALHRAAGPELLAACRQLRATDLPHGLQTGAAVATAGFRLPARWVIHTVGPNRHAGQTNRALLVSASAKACGWPTPWAPADWRFLRWVRALTAGQRMPSHRRPGTP